MVKVRPGSRKGRTKFVKSVRKSAKKRAAKNGSAKLQKKAVIHEAMRDAWDETATPASNLNRLGLQSNVNVIPKALRAPAALDPADVPMEDAPSAPRDRPATPAAARARQRLERHAGMPERGTKRIVRPGERAALQKLVDRYGDDWTRMSRDKKLNYLQWTPAQLKKKIERMQAILAEQKS